MNQIKKTALLALAGAALVSTANAQYTANNNDLLLGFTPGTPSTDYIIDLGSATAVGVGGSSVVDLSGSVSLSQLQSLYGLGMANLQLGVVGGSKLGNGDIYSTILRDGGAGVASSANTSLTAPGQGSSSATKLLVNYPNTIGGNLLSSSSSATVATSDSSSWKSVMLPGSPAVGGTFTEDYHNPDSTYSGTGLLYEDLYQAVGGASGAAVYKGYFTFGNDGTFTFTPATLAVPEPSVYGVFAGAGLLLLSLGRQFTRKQQA
jgi:hypothetical protein